MDTDARDKEPIMSDSKPLHTPGPWLLCTSDDKTCLINGPLEEWPHDPAVPGLHTPRRRVIARTMGADDEGIANARLIAASPNLLARAKSVVHAIYVAGECDIAKVDDLSTAITAAEQ